MRDQTDAGAKRPLRHRGYRPIECRAVESVPGQQRHHPITGLLVVADVAPDRQVDAVPDRLGSPLREGVPSHKQPNREKAATAAARPAELIELPPLVAL